jgi:hypothetical protein
MLTPFVYMAGSATLAAPPQDRPGVPTKASVWVENRRADEAIPVAIVPRPDATPDRVEVVGAVALPATTIIGARRVRQQWDYSAITIPSGQNPIEALQSAGEDGWEVTGVLLPAPNATMLLLKRSR